MSSESMSPYQAPTSDTQGNEPMNEGTSPIPKVFGILHLVFGGLGIVFGLFAIVGAAFTDKIQELQYSGYPDEMRDRMMSAMQPVYETQKWDVISSFFSIVLAVLMVKKFQVVSFTLVVAWALWGIYNAQGPAAPILASLTALGIGVLISTVLFTLIYKLRKNKMA